MVCKVMWGIVIIGAVITVGLIIGSAFDNADELGREGGGKPHDVYDPALNIEMPSDIVTMTEEECRRMHVQLDRQKVMLDAYTDIQNHRLAREYLDEEMRAKSQFEMETGLSYDHIHHPECLPPRIKDKWNSCCRAVEMCERGLMSLEMTKNEYKEE